ncbi:MAG: hypothetical protein OSJ66_07335 [Clostridia bacterium]|nr:hypothetical protein [Clostridia bacterium]
MIDKEIPNINVLRLEYGLEKICRCQDKKYEIDIQNRLVWCQTCKAVIDPFEALKYLALHIDTINESIKHAIDYRNELMNYKPYLREAKRLESQMRHKDMLPVCPKCNNTFEWGELNCFHNRNY